MNLSEWQKLFLEEFWRITPHSDKGREALDQQVREESLQYMDQDPKEAAMSLHSAKYCKGSALKHEDNCWCFPF